MTMKTKTAVIVVAVAAVVLGFLMYRYYTIPRAVSSQFNGAVLALNTQKNYFEAQGFFVVPDAVRPEEVTQDKKVKVFVSRETKIIKTLLYLPSSKELEKTGGRFRPDDLRRETVDARLEDLVVLVGTGQRVLITASKNVYNKSSFTATKIEYIEPIYPK